MNVIDIAIANSYTDQVAESSYEDGDEVEY